MLLAEIKQQGLNLTHLLITHGHWDHMCDGRYFADWVTDLVPGFAGPDHGDVIVRTTLDLKMQRAAEQRLEALLAGPGGYKIHAETIIAGNAT